MSGIDDPIAAAKKRYPEPSSMKNAAELLIDVAAQSSPFAGMANAIREFFSAKQASERVKALLDQLEWYIREHESRLDRLEEKMNAPEFIETLLVAVDESLHTANTEKIRCFAKVLGHELLHGGGAKSLENAAVYIRDLSELGEADIEVLSILHNFQRSLDLEYVARTGIPVVLEPMRLAVREAQKRGIPREELYFRLSRLAGYGLVLQMDKARFGASPDEFVFLTTSNGKNLIRILTT